MSTEVQLARHAVHPALRGLVVGMVGLAEEAGSGVRRRQPAGSVLPLVLSFGSPIEVDAPSEGTGAGIYGSFLAGPMSGFVDTAIAGSYRCVQVYLTPSGVSRLVGQPAREAAGRVIDVADVGPQGRIWSAISERLADTATWHERLALVEAALLARAGRTDAAEDDLGEWMWRQLARSGGQASIAGLVEQTGFSHRHVVARFRRHTGMTPKGAAGVIRFERASNDLGSRSLAEVADRHGYADQSHLTRDFQRRAGESPAAFQAARRPTPATALGQSSGS